MLVFPFDPCTSHQGQNKQRLSIMTSPKGYGPALLIEELFEYSLFRD